MGGISVGGVSIGGKFVGVLGEIGAGTTSVCNCSVLIFHVFVFLIVLVPIVGHVTFGKSIALLVVRGMCSSLMPNSLIFSAKIFVFHHKLPTFSILPIIVFSCSICRPDQVSVIFSAWLSPSALIHFPFCSTSTFTSV